jgi:uncharacterized protein YkwD
MEWYVIVLIVIGIGGMMTPRILKFFKKSEVNKKYRYQHIEYLEGNFRDVLLKLVNKHRIRIGVPEVLSDFRVTQQANNRCWEMLEDNVVSHSGFDGEHVLLVEEGADSVGENIGYGYSNASSFMSAFLRSPKHKALLENEKYSYIGIGEIENDDERIYCCMMFVAD